MANEIQEIISDFHDLLRAWEKGAETTAKKITDNFVYMINIVGAVDTGDFLRSVDYHEGQTGIDVRRFVIDESNDPKVIYGGFIEGGTKFMKARYPAQKGIERTDFEVLFDAFMDEGLKHAE